VHESAGGAIQANALAQAISARCGVLADPFVLARVKPTPPQVGLSRAQRALNLQGALRVDIAMAPRIEGRAIVLIDDVMTSGATANAAARAVARRCAAGRCVGVCPGGLEKGVYAPLALPAERLQELVERRVASVAYLMQFSRDAELDVEVTVRSDRTFQIHG
jgi:adenine/guanine phosphoribosyltransferase-like PRPP-binding protein